MTTAWPTRSSAAIAAAVVLAAVVCAPQPASAHRLDEYLQAARIAVGHDGARVDLDLTPGAAVADAIVALIDRDRDGVLSAVEQRAYMDAVVRALDVRLDGARLSPRLVSFAFPEPSAFAEGAGRIAVTLGVDHPGLAGGAHELSLRNGHLPDRSVYLANALVPESAEIAITRQTRSVDQRELTIHYVVGATAAHVSAGWIAVGLAALGALIGLRRFPAVGVLHLRRSVCR